MLWFLVAADPTPSPSPSQIDPNLVTPGVAGFIAIALVSIASVLLIVDMVRRVRRVRYRAEIQERLAAEARGETTPEADDQ